MSVMNNILKKIRAVTPKQLVVAGVFSLALTGAVGLGLANRQSTNALGLVRDCDNGNSILNVSPCGALNADELIADLKSGNPADADEVLANNEFTGLTTDKYDRFKNTAVMGKTWKDGRIQVEIDGKFEDVATEARSMGRFSHNKPTRYPIVINGKTYYWGYTKDSFGQNTDFIWTLVMFDDEGTMESAVLTACGNPVTGKKVKSGAECKMLNKTPVAGKQNTYSFTTDVSKFGLAKIAKVEYFVDGQLIATKTNPADAVEHTFTKSAEVTAKVHVDLPGGKKKVVTSVKCKTNVEVKQPFYTCEKLIATARDNTNRKFRFTAIAKYGDGATLKNVDFVLDGTNETKGVTQKDENGNIYKDYDFTDAVEHEVIAKVNFNVGSDVKTKACAAKVTPTEEPKCPYNPQLPPDSPDCKKPPEECKPGIPVNDARCNPPEMPNTGAGSMLGLFTGVSIAGGAAHRLYLRFRG